MSEPGRFDTPGRRDAPGPAGGGGRADARGPARGVLVIGYGNALRSDDGVGVHAAGLLARDPRLARVEVRAAVQLAPEMALDMSRVGLVVLVDATVDAAPGPLVVRRLGDAAAEASPPAAPGPAASGPGAISHHVGAEQLVALAGELYGAAPEVVIVSVGVATMDAGEALSPDVEAALPDVADMVAALVAGRA